MDQSTPPTTEPVSPSTTAGHVTYLTCTTDQIPCPTDAQQWTLVDPYAPPTRQQMREQQQLILMHVFVPFIVVCFFAWAARQIVDMIE